MNAYALHGGDDDNRLIALAASIWFTGGTGIDCGSTFSGGSNTFEMGSGDDDVWGDPSSNCPGSFERRATTWLCTYEEAFTTNGACP